MDHLNILVIKNLLVHVWSPVQKLRVGLSTTLRQRCDNAATTLTSQKLSENLLNRYGCKQFNFNDKTVLPVFRLVLCLQHVKENSA